MIVACMAVSMVIVVVAIVGVVVMVVVGVMVVVIVGIMVVVVVVMVVVVIVVMAIVGVMICVLMVVVVTASHGASVLSDRTLSPRYRIKLTVPKVLLGHSVALELDKKIPHRFGGVTGQAELKTKKRIATPSAAIRSIGV